MRRLLVSVLALALAGCGGSSSPTKQAEEIQSLAAEGAILAHEASEGDTTGPFARVHARELAEAAQKAARRALTPRLRGLATRVADQLERLENDPHDRAGAVSVERGLEDVADAAERLAR
jgi:hypothetical protein